MQLVTFKLKSLLIYHSENPESLKNYSISIPPVLYKCYNKACITIHLFTTWFSEYFKPTVETFCSGKKKNKRIHLKILWFIENVLDHLRALMKIYKINDVLNGC